MPTVETLHATSLPTVIIEYHRITVHCPADMPTMADLFRNRYRVPSARATWWDYGRDAAYFVTICTHDRQHFFGEVENGEMVLTELGMLAGEIWQMIPAQFPFVRLQEWVVMPNHIHGIIIIDRRDAINRVSATDNADAYRDAVDRDAIGRDAINRVSTTDDAVAGRDAVNRVSTGGATGNKNPMLHQNLSTIMRWFKGRATFETRKIHADFAWQARFHDHIIRDADNHEKIRYYILNNPLLWDKDRFNPNNR